LLLLSPLALCAQTQPPTVDQFVGNYKGTAKMGSGEMDVTLEIKSANGKLSGRAVAAGTEYQINSAQVVEGKLALKFATADAASLTLQQREGKLVGDWIDGAQKGTVELKKVAAEPSAAEFLTGQWDAAADANGQAFPFSLTLKVDGEKVTGGSISELGQSTISSGSWKDGKLVFILDSANGQIGMVAGIVDGKLVGDFDYSGQMTGKWAAVKKKP
jgi:hypothetical protein